MLLGLLIRAGFNSGRRNNGSRKCFWLEGVCTSSCDHRMGCVFRMPKVRLGRLSVFCTWASCGLLVWRSGRCWCVRYSRGRGWKWWGRWSSYSGNYYGLFKKMWGRGKVNWWCSRVYRWRLGGIGKKRTIKKWNSHIFKCEFTIQYI